MNNNRSDYPPNKTVCNLKKIEKDSSSVRHRYFVHDSLNWFLEDFCNDLPVKTIGGIMQEKVQ